MRIGELAKKASVTPRTVRHYESLGLLEPSERERGGFRYYAEAELLRLQKINALKELGLSLEEISSIISLYFNDPSGQQGKLKILGILRTHLRETDQKLAALTQFRAELQANIDRIQEWSDERTKKE